MQQTSAPSLGQLQGNYCHVMGKELMPLSVKQLERVLIIKSTIIAAFLAKISCYINNLLSTGFSSTVLIGMNDADHEVSF